MLCIWFSLTDDEKIEVKKEHTAQWVIDSNFSKELERLKISKGET